MPNYDSEEMARRGRIAASKGVLRGNCEKAAVSNRGDKKRGNKISKTLKELLKNPEIRRKRSNLAKKQWANPLIREKMIDGIVQSMSNNPIKKRYSDTAPELVMKEILVKLGLEYQAQHPMFGVLWDFVVVGAKLIIEVDGCYWHSCPRHHPNRDPERIAIDKERTELAELNGWTVKRVWEHDLTDAYK